MMSLQSGRQFEPQRRSRLEMACDVLQALSDGAKRPTKVMQAANLTWRALLIYLDVLIRNDFIAREVRGRSVVYSLTERGEEALRHYRELRESLAALELEKLSEGSISKVLSARLVGRAGGRLRAELAESLKEDGYELLEGSLRGKSGVRHDFDVLAKSPDGTLHGYVIAERQEGRDVLTLFAKQLDTDAVVHAVYTAEATDEAVRLAKSYSIELLRWRGGGGRAGEWFDATRLAGNGILLEVDTSSRYERGVRRIAEEFASKGHTVYLFSWKGSPVYEVLSGLASVNLRTMTTDVSYSKQVGKREYLIPQGDRAVLLQEMSRAAESAPSGKALIVFDSVSDMIVLQGVEQTYSFLRTASGLVSGGRATLVCVLKRHSHDEKTESLVKGVFLNALVYDSSGLRSGKMGTA
jgi:predicted transcriptional regulator